MTIEEIKSAKKQLSWTNTELAERAGIPISTVAKILGGTTKNPRQASIQAMENAIIAASPCSASGISESGNRPFEGNSTGKDSLTTGQAAAAASSMPGFAASYTIPRATPSFVCETPYIYGTEALKSASGNMENEDNPDRKESIYQNNEDALLHHPGAYTIQDYLALPDDARVELIDGRFYPIEPPSGLHQKILFHIAKTLDACSEEHNLSCEVQVAPFDVQLFHDPFTVVQPDVMVFCTHPEEALGRRAHSAPDFIAEILSPLTGFRDRTQKLCRYRDAGVKEVWIVSPMEQKIFVYRFYEGQEDPAVYTFHDAVPLGISDKRCAVDFSKMLKYLRNSSDQDGADGSDGSDLQNMKKPIIHTIEPQH